MTFLLYLKNIQVWLNDLNRILGAIMPHLAEWSKLLSKKKQLMMK